MPFELWEILLISLWISASSPGRGSSEPSLEAPASSESRSSTEKKEVALEAAAPAGTSGSSSAASAQSRAVSRTSRGPSGALSRGPGPAPGAEESSSSKKLRRGPRPPAASSSKRTKCSACEPQNCASSRLPTPGMPVKLHSFRFTKEVANMMVTNLSLSKVRRERSMGTCFPSWMCQVPLSSSVSRGKGSGPSETTTRSAARTGIVMLARDFASPKE
mmetsp:Transcript_23999/g.69292  ORF Transcript_23999/g.69292 Transcript_23999/m.69292 type:complete len:218 (+) Transcript_23999:524-1177(+)